MGGKQLQPKRLFTFASFVITLSIEIFLGKTDIKNEEKKVQNLMQTDLAVKSFIKKIHVMFSAGQYIDQQEEDVDNFGKYLKILYSQI